jgi:hypothetical protein
MRNSSGANMLQEAIRARRGSRTWMELQEELPDRPAEVKRLMDMSDQELVEFARDHVPGGRVGPLRVLYSTEFEKDGEVIQLVAGIDGAEAEPFVVSLLDGPVGGDRHGSLMWSGSSLEEGLRLMRSDEQHFEFAGYKPKGERVELTRRRFCEELLDLTLGRWRPAAG